MYYIDAGYYTYRMGSRWPFSHWITYVDPEFLRTGVFLMDSAPESRLEELPSYKGRRLQRRIDDPAKKEIAERVAEFRRSLHQPIFGLRTVEVRGSEADDLLAIFSRTSTSADYFVATDKDFAQLKPDLKFLDSALQPIDIAGRVLEKWPAYCSRMLESRPTNRWFALVQALLGDRSDSIPRVLPLSKRLAYPIVQGVLEGDLEVMDPEAQVKFLVNLRLVTLPHPSFIQGNPRGLELFEQLLTGDYDLEPLFQGYSLSIGEELV